MSPPCWEVGCPRCVPTSLSPHPTVQPGGEIFCLHGAVVAQAVEDDGLCPQAVVEGGRAQLTICRATVQGGRHCGHPPTPVGAQQCHLPTTGPACHLGTEKVIGRLGTTPHTHTETGLGTRCGPQIGTQGAGPGQGQGTEGAGTAKGWQLRVLAWQRAGDMGRWQGTGTGTLGGGMARRHRAVSLQGPPSALTDPIWRAATQGVPAVLTMGEGTEAA